MFLSIWKTASYLALIIDELLTNAFFQIYTLFHHDSILFNLLLDDALCWLCLLWLNHDPSLFIELGGNIAKREQSRIPFDLLRVFIGILCVLLVRAEYLGLT